MEQHIRGKWHCGKCETLVQAPVPAQIIDKGIPTAGLLTRKRVAKSSANHERQLIGVTSQAVGLPESWHWRPSTPSADLSQTYPLPKSVMWIGRRQLSDSFMEVCSPHRFFCCPQADTHEHPLLVVKSQPPPQNVRPKLDVGTLIKSGYSRPACGGCQHRAHCGH